jgi:hypothetical protein
MEAEACEPNEQYNIFKKYIKYLNRRKGWRSGLVSKISINLPNQKCQFFSVDL